MMQEVDDRIAEHPRRNEARPEKKRIAAELYSSDSATRDAIDRSKCMASCDLGLLSELAISRKSLDQVGGAVRSTAQFDVRVVYSDVVDVEAEKARLKKEIEGLQKAISSKESQLGNETFRSKAPEKIIRGLEATLGEQRIELQKIVERLGQL